MAAAAARQSRTTPLEACDVPPDAISAGVESTLAERPTEQHPQTHPRYGLQTNTAHYAQTMVQHHCWQHARHTADWVISSSHGWDMFLFSPRGESLQALLSRLPPGEMSVVEGLRYGTREDCGGRACYTAICPNYHIRRICERVWE